MLTFNEYMTLVEQAPIMIWRSGRDKLCNYFNERWLKFTGRSFEQELGNGWTEGVHPEDFDQCLKIYTEHFDRVEIFEMEYRLRRYDGEYRWIFDRGVPFYSEGGDFAGYIGSCIDVHEKIEAQKKLDEIHRLEIERLQKMLPICSWCSKIRTDDGYWQEIEEYFASIKAGTPTHGICDECMEKVKSQFVA